MMSEKEQQSETDSESDSESSDAEMDEAQETELKDRVATLTAQLEKYPSAYDLHTELIDALKKLGELEQLTAARERMNSIYPLSPTLWLDWIRDARSIACTLEEKKQVECLFKRAIEDYEDVDVWLEYCHFAISNYDPDSVESVQVTQEIFETALSHQGLNVASGTVLWDIYREFQFLVLAQLSKDPSQSVDEHLRKMDKLFRRQLSIPLMNMQNTLTEYEEFLKGVGSSLYPVKDQSSPVPSECMEEYKKATAQLESLLEFEEKIEDIPNIDEAAAVAAWEAYLDWAVESARTKSGTDGPGSKRSRAKTSTSSTPPPPLLPNQICCLFERAVTAHCLYPSIWIRFVNYLEDVLGVDKPRLLRTFARAVRNCPWSVAVWIRYALATEVTVMGQLVDGATNGLDESDHKDIENRAFDKVEAVFNAALLSGLQQESDLLQLWTAYCDYRLRRLLRAPKDSPEWKIHLVNLRDTFDRATAELIQQFGNRADPESTLLRYHALIEAKFVEDMGAARSIWSSLMQLPGRGSQSKFWLAYLEFERNWGDVKHFSRICRMAINSISEQTDTSFAAILRLCVEAGLPTLQYQELESRIRSHHRTLLDRRAATDPAESNASVTSTQPEPVPETKTKARQKPPQSDVSGKKRPATAEKQPVPAKKAKIHDAKQSASTVSSTPSGHVVPHGESVPHDPSRENRTVFVSNLDYSVNENQIRETFESCGALSSVRLVRDYAGRSKGYAYVEFEDEKSVPSALAKDRQPVSGTEQTSTADTDQPVSFARPMFVSPCDPSRTKTGSAFRFTAGREEPEKLFVRNLDKRVTKEALETLFGQHGTVVSVRLATYRNGAPKGHAYVEFASAEEASRALIATDGLMVGSRNIAVAISNPPVRGEQQLKTASGEKDTHSSATNSTDRPQFAIPEAPIHKPRTHARTQLDFLPRAIHRTAASTEVGTSAPTAAPPPSDSSVQSKSNADFRKMFLS